MTGLEAGAVVATGLATTTSIIRGARELTEELNALLGDGGLVPAELLRVVYLDVEYNLRVLSVVPDESTKGAAGGTDSAYFQYAHLLRIDSLVAVLMEFRDKHSTLSGRWFSKIEGYKEVLKDLKTKDLLSLTREVVISVQALQAISSLDPEVRKRTRNRERLLNVRTRLQMLRAVLTQQKVLESLSAKVQPSSKRSHSDTTA